MVVSQEDGVQTAIQAIYRDLEYAKRVVKARAVTQGAAGAALTSVDVDEGEGEEESWTFIGDESDPELQRRLQYWDADAAPTPSPVRGRAPRVSLDQAGLTAMQGVEPVRKGNMK